MRSIVHAFVLALGLWLAQLPDSAHAGPLYQLSGGVCTNSNRLENLGTLPVPPFVIVGVGDKICADNIAATLAFNGTYLPGAPFWDYDRPSLKFVVEHFTFNDGPGVISDPLVIIGRGGYIRGTMPVLSGLADVDVLWQEGYYFRTSSAGQWIFGIEFRNFGAPCGPTSIPGPAPVGVCVYYSHYFSEGTYQGWNLIPTPSALSLALLALGLLGLVRHVLSAARAQIAQPAGSASATRLSVRGLNVDAQAGKPG